MSDFIERDYDMHDLKQDMAYLKVKLSKMDITIHGPDDSHEPMGLKHAVGRNSEFRRNAAKVLWIIGSALIVIIITLIFDGAG